MIKNGSLDLQNIMVRRRYPRTKWPTIARLACGFFFLCCVLRMILPFFPAYLFSFLFLCGLALRTNPTEESFVQWFSHQDISTLKRNQSWVSTLSSSWNSMWGTSNSREEEEGPVDWFRYNFGCCTLIQLKDINDSEFIIGCFNTWIWTSSPSMLLNWIRKNKSLLQRYCIEFQESSMKEFDVKARASQSHSCAQDGQRLRHQKRWHDAAQAFQKAAAAGTSRESVTYKAKYQIEAARCYLKDQNYAQAYQQLYQAIPIWMDQGEFYTAGKTLKEFADQFELIVRRKSATERGHIVQQSWITDCYLDAIHSFEAASVGSLSFHANLFQCQWSLGNYYMHQKQWVEGHSIFEILGTKYQEESQQPAFYCTQKRDKAYFNALLCILALKDRQRLVQVWTSYQHVIDSPDIHAFFHDMLLVWDSNPQNAMNKYASAYAQYHSVFQFTVPQQNALEEFSNTLEHLDLT